MPAPLVPKKAARRSVVTLSDVLLPVAILLWWAAVHTIKPAAMNGYGLVPALPVSFYCGLAILIVSFVAALAQPRLSPLRLGLHVAGLVLMLHGTVPMVFPASHYTWVYKHFGVTDYIGLHGAVDARIDIYHSWPGFFALGAWFTRLAGAGDPAEFAAWSQVVFNLLICLQLNFIFSSLGTNRRLRWLGLFVFVSASWVGQDYFAPQALSFMLALGVFGILLRWLGPQGSSRVMDRFRRLAWSLTRSPDRDDGFSTAQPIPAVTPRTRFAAIAGVHVLFLAITISHQLTPYMVLAGVAGLVVVGAVRPRWIVVSLTAVALGYLLPRFGYTSHNYDLLGSFLNPFHNATASRIPSTQGAAGRVFVSQMARLLSVSVWGLAGVGLFRRVRQRVPSVALAVLAASPILMVFAQDYGGEAIYRVYLFSLPWAAFLAASALCPRGERWSKRASAGVALALAGLVGLFLPAYFGLEEINQVRPGEVTAARFFYDHADKGSVLLLSAPNFPVRSTATYDQFQTPAGAFDPNLLNIPAFRNRMLGTADLEAIADVVRQFERPEGGTGYIVISKGIKTYAEVFGLLPKGSLDSLEVALGQSMNWELFYRNDDAVIYKLLDRQ